MPGLRRLVAAERARVLCVAVGVVAGCGALAGAVGVGNVAGKDVEVDRGGADVIVAAAGVVFAAKVDSPSSVFSRGKSIFPTSFAAKSDPDPVSVLISIGPISDKLRSCQNKSYLGLLVSLTSEVKGELIISVTPPGHGLKF